jgi:hypothetical protein
VSDVRLDSIPGCIAELTTCNREVAEFAHEWAEHAGELKQKEKLYDRLFKAAMRGTNGRNADERAATAQAAIENEAPGLAEEIEDLIGSVETHKTLFKTIDRRAGNAQSILSAHREAQKTEDYVAAQQFGKPRPVA